MYPNTSPTAWSPAARTQAQPADARHSLLLALTDADLQRTSLPAFTRFPARSTGEVLALLSKERPSAVVIDHDVNAFDAAAVCRAVVPYEATSVLVLMTEPKHAPIVIKAGCHAILLKPFAPNLLAARLGRLVREHAQQLRLRALRPMAVNDQWGTNRTWRNVTCPRCTEPNATSFEFASYRRMWFACLGCDQVWIAARQE
jgi:DNA-binding response OmpR family regulator